MSKLQISPTRTQDADTVVNFSPMWSNWKSVFKDNQWEAESVSFISLATPPRPLWTQKSLPVSLLDPFMAAKIWWGTSPSMTKARNRQITKQTRKVLLPLLFSKQNKASALHNISHMATQVNCMRQCIAAPKIRLVLEKFIIYTQCCSYCELWLKKSCHIRALSDCRRKEKGGTGRGGGGQGGGG